MATAKKTTKKTTAKKTTVKRAPAKAAPKTKVTHKAAPKKAPVKSFKRSSSIMPFMTFELTIQTLYWAILCGLVLALGVWVMSINIQVQQLYDQIDATNQSMSELTY